MLSLFQQPLNKVISLTIKGKNFSNKDNFMTFIVRSTSLGDFTVALPFIASVLKESQNIKFLLISKVGNVGEDILPQWKNDIVVIEPSLFYLLRKWKKLPKFNQDKVAFDKVLVALQSGMRFFDRLKYFIFIRSILGINAQIIGLGINQKLRTRHQCEAEPDVISVNVALAPFLACDITPQASRFDCQSLLGITDKESNEVSQLLDSLGVKSTSNSGIAFYVHAKDERKRWPIDRFLYVASEIIKQYDYEVLLIGGSADKSISEEIVKQLPFGKAFALAGMLSVRQTFSLLSRCTLFVGNDGSPTHMAAIQGCYCVTVYCNWEVHGFWEPIVAPASISLRPAWNNTERKQGNFGIENIPAGAVFDAAKYFLDSSTIPPIHRINFYENGSYVQSQVVKDKVLIEA